jgi:hypothetical protein
MPPANPREGITILQACPRTRSPARNPQTAHGTPLLAARREQHVFGKNMIVQWREKGRGRILNRPAMTGLRSAFFAGCQCFCCALVRAADARHMMCFASWPPTQQ